MLLCIAAATGLARSIQDGDATLSAPIREALERNAASLAPVAVSWERRRSADLPLPDLLARLHTRALDFLDTAVGRAAIDGGKVHVLTSPKLGNPRRTHNESITANEWAFDNQNFYSGTGIEWSKNIGSDAVMMVQPIETIRKKSPNSRRIEPLYFTDAGFYIPRTPIELGQPPRSLILAMLDRGARVESIGDESIDGERCPRVTLIEGDRIHNFFLSPRFHHAVRRHVERSTDKGLIRVLDNLNFDHADPERAALPRRCVTQWHWWRDSSDPSSPTPLFTSEIVVTELSRSPVPPERFALNYDVPGAHVVDATLPESDGAREGRVTYQVPAKPEDLPATISKAASEQRAAATWPFWAWPAVGFVGVLFACLAGMLLLRRRPEGGLSRSDSPRRTGSRGVTLIELLVVIAIIGLLIGLLLPALQSARESARRTQCLNQLKQLALAAQNYAGSFGVYPMGTPAMRYADTSRVFNHSVFVALLPQLDQSPLYNAVNFDVNIYRYANHTVQGAALSTLFCPSDPSIAAAYRLNDSPYADMPPGVFVAHHSSYAASAGTWYHLVFDLDQLPALAAQDNGLCHANSAVRPAQVTDGLSNTLLFAERAHGRIPVERRGGPHWWFSGYMYDTLFWTLHPINADRVVGPILWFDNEPNAWNASAGSFHPGGAQVAFADGSARFVKDTIDSWPLDADGYPRGVYGDRATPYSFATGTRFGVWQALSTRSGGEVVPAE